MRHYAWAALAGSVTTVCLLVCCSSILLRLGLEQIHKDVFAAGLATNSVWAASPSAQKLNWLSNPLLSVGLDFPIVASANVQLDKHGCVTNFDPTADYFSPENRALMTSTVSDGVASSSTVTFATDFSIEYFRTFKIVRDLKTSKVYVLHHCGAGAAPLAADLPADAIAAPIFTVPVRSWSTAGTTSLGYMELLGLLNKAVIIDPSYASSSCLLKLVGCGVIQGIASTGGGEFSAYAYAVRNSTSTLQIGGGSYSRIDVDFSATFDSGALARAEWIKYLAAFFNLEPHANRVFAGIKAEFDQTKELTAAAAAAVAPKVLWISDYCDGGCAATISTASYKMDYVKAAGGVTPAAADLAKHCPKNLATTFGPYDSAVSAADIALGYVNAFVCTDAGLKALLAAGIDVVIDESSADSFVTNNFGDNLYRLSNFMGNFGFSSAQTAERLRQLQEAEVAGKAAVLRTALREAEAFAASRPHLLEGESGEQVAAARVFLAETEAEAVERAAKARARRDERIMGQTAERPLKDYPFLNKVLRADRLMGQSNAQGYATFGTAWFEDAIPRADITLDDLAFYLHPTLMPRTYKPRFFRNIAASEMVTLATAAACDDPYPYATCPKTKEEERQKRRLDDFYLRTWTVAMVGLAACTTFAPGVFMRLAARPLVRMVVIVLWGLGLWRVAQSLYKYMAANVYVLLIVYVTLRYVVLPRVWPQED